MKIVLTILLILSAACGTLDAFLGGTPEETERRAAAYGRAADEALRGTPYGAMGIGGAITAAVTLAGKIIGDSRRNRGKRAEQWKAHEDNKTRIAALERELALLRAAVAPAGVPASG